MDGKLSTVNTHTLTLYYTVIVLLVGLTLTHFTRSHMFTRSHSFPSISLALPFYLFISSGIGHLFISSCPHMTVDPQPSVILYPPMYVVVLHYCHHL